MRFYFLQLRAPIPGIVTTLGMRRHEKVAEDEATAAKAMAFVSIQYYFDWVDATGMRVR